MAPESHNIRLERMEEKIDKLSEAIVALARVEEKISSLESTNSTLMRQVIAIDEKTRLTDENLTALRMQQVQDSAMIHGLKKFLWILISAILSGAFLVWFTVITSAVHK